MSMLKRNLRSCGEQLESRAFTTYIVPWLIIPPAEPVAVAECAQFDIHVDINFDDVIGCGYVDPDADPTADPDPNDDPPTDSFSPEDFVEVGEEDDNPLNPPRIPVLEQ